MELTMVWKYITPKKKEVELTSARVSAKEALIFTKDFEKTGRMKDIYFLDELGTTWNKKELEKYLQGIETEPHDITAYFDGGYDKATKRAGVGAVIYFQQNGKHYRIRKNALLEELDSNNEAEYAAFWFLLNTLEELGAQRIPVAFKGDSLVVLNQLAGEWPCYDEALSRWLDRIEEKLNKLGINPKYESINRKDNKEADELAKQAIMGVDISSQVER